MTEQIKAKPGAAAKAAEAEATDTMLDVSYGGHAYQVPAARGDWNIDVLSKLRGDSPDEVGALKALLGDEQYATFRSRHSKVREMDEMFEAMSEAGLGNS